MSIIVWNEYVLIKNDIVIKYIRVYHKISKYQNIYIYQFSND